MAENKRYFAKKSNLNPYEDRYVIVDSETGEIVDDAQGYGYRTPQKAYAAWGYKQKNNTPGKLKQRKREEKLIKQWWSEHKQFETMVADAAFHASKNGESFTLQDFKELFMSENLDSEISIKKLFKFQFKHQ